MNITVRLGKYAVFAQEGVAFKQNSAVMRGDMGVNVKSAGPFLRNNVEASFGQNSLMQDPTSRVLADSIVVDNNGVIYNPSYNDLTGKGVVNGTRTTPLALPLRSALPALPTITPGTQAVTVSGSQTLAPGSYDTLIVNNNATLVLSGGLYTFASWNVGLGAKVHFAAPSEVRIAGALVVNANSYVGPTPGVTNMDANSIIIHVAGTDGQSNPGNFPKAATFEQNVTVSAYLLAPNGLVNFRQNGVATGTFIGKWVLVEQNSKVTRPSDPVVRAASAEGAGGETLVITTTESTLPESTPTVVVTTSTDLLKNAVYLPVVTVNAAVVGSEAVVSEIVVSEQAVVEATPVITALATVTMTARLTPTVTSEAVAITSTIGMTATVPLTEMSGLTAPANQAPAAPADIGQMIRLFYLPLVVGATE